MAKKYSVACIDPKYSSPISLKSSSSSMPLPEEFDSKENAEKYIQEVKRQYPNIICSLDEEET
jgi:hypothetical protein